MKKRYLLIAVGLVILSAITWIIGNQKGILSGKTEKEKKLELITAIHKHDNEKIKEYTGDGYPINFISNEGLTPLETAINDRYLDSAEILLDNGAKINDKPNTPPLLIQIVATLDNYDQIKNSSDYKQIMTSYQSIIKKAIKKDRDIINQTNEIGNTALHVAATTGHEEMIDFLIKLGAKPKLQNKQEETPLLIATQLNHLEVVKFLFSYHDFKLDKDINGNNLIISAAMNGRNQLLSFLLEQTREEIDTKNNEGKTALMIAAEYGYTETVEILIKNEANLALKSKEGRTALSYAEQWKHKEVINLIQNR